MKVPICTYLEHCEGSLGALVINGLVFPHNPGFDPLAKIWSSCRKRIREQYDIDVAGIFVYDEDESVVSCSFCLSFTLGVPEEIYIRRFEKTFTMQMAMFEKAIKDFLLDEDDGYNAYCKLVEHRTDKKALDGALNKFLRKIGLKRPGDNRKKTSL